MTGPIKPIPFILPLKKNHCSKEDCEVLPPPSPPKKKEKKNHCVQNEASYLCLHIQKVPEAGHHLDSQCPILSTKQYSLQRP